MSIILFGGSGASEKLMKVEYKNNKYVKNNFINSLEKISNLYIPEIKYKNVYYYQKNDIYNQKKYFKPIKNLILDDLLIENTIKNLIIDKRKKYIVIGISDGIYFAMEFVKQYKKSVKEVISLDGSWISTKLCYKRLENWQKKGKKVRFITNQTELDEIVSKLINDKDESSFRKIVNHKRLEHTKKCISKKYQNLIKNVKFTLFRDYNSKINDDIDRQFNEYALLEHDILSKISKNYQIFWQIDASHLIWSKDAYKNQIINYISLILNN